MGEIPTPDSPLEALAGTAGPRAIDAFSVLGNETRLSIMLALWDEFEPFAPEEEAVSFTNLRNRVGVNQGAQFNYHLDKLVGRFVRKTDAGYELRRAGLKIVRAVIAGSGIEDPSIDPTEIDLSCIACGAPTAITYEDEWLYLVCTECDGFFAEYHDRPGGILKGMAFDPAGLTDRTPEEMWGAAYPTMIQCLESAVRGVCDICSGTMEYTLDICQDHAEEDVCDACGRRIALMARFHCPVCKNHHAAPPRTIVTQHPAVIAFYYDRGVSIRYEVDDFEGTRQLDRLIKNHEQELVSTDPIRIRVRIPYESDELALVLDEHLAVVEANEP